MKYEIEIDGRLVMMDDDKDYYVNKQGDWFTHNRRLNVLAPEFWVYDDDVDDIITHECVAELEKSGSNWISEIMKGPGRFVDKSRKVYELLGG